MRPTPLTPIPTDCPGDKVFVIEKIETETFASIEGTANA